jgi:hypothetical protein
VAAAAQTAESSMLLRLPKPIHFDDLPTLRQAEAIQTGNKFRVVNQKSPKQIKNANGN